MAFRYHTDMEPQWGGEKVSPEKDHTLTDRVCTFQTVGAECRDQRVSAPEPQGKIFLLTFTLIGPSELYDAMKIRERCV